MQGHATWALTTEHKQKHLCTSMSTGLICSQTLVAVLQIGRPYFACVVAEQLYEIVPFTFALYRHLKSDVVRPNGPSASPRPLDVSHSHHSEHLAVTQSVLFSHISKSLKQGGGGGGGGCADILILSDSKSTKSVKAYYRRAPKKK